MARDPNELHSETDSARAGSTPHIVRWILAISLLATIVLLSIIWITGAATQSDDEAQISATRAIQSQEDDARGTEGIDEGFDEIEDAPADRGLDTTRTIENEQQETQ